MGRDGHEQHSMNQENEMADEMPGSFAACWAEIAALRARVAALEAVNRRRMDELQASRARVAELEADADRLNWLEANPRLSIIRLAGQEDQDCYMYAVAGAPGLKLREIIDAARAATNAGDSTLKGGSHGRMD